MSLCSLEKTRDPETCRLHCHWLPAPGQAGTKCQLGIVTIPASRGWRGWWGGRGEGGGEEDALGMKIQRDSSVHLSFLKEEMPPLQKQWCKYLCGFTSLSCAYLLPLRVEPFLPIENSFYQDWMGLILPAPWPHDPRPGQSEAFLPSALGLLKWQGFQYSSCLWHVESQ